MSYITSCSCTNQCPQCGACCAVGCEHRGSVSQWPPQCVPTVTTTSSSLPWTVPVLSEERVREIVQEEIGRAIRKAFRWRK